MNFLEYSNNVDKLKIEIIIIIIIIYNNHIQNQNTFNIPCMHLIMFKNVIIMNTSQGKRIKKNSSGIELS